MAMYFLVYLHFLVMLMLMLMLIIIVAGIIGFLFLRFLFYIVLIGSGLIGYVYTFIVYLGEFSLFFIAVNVLAALVVMVLVKWLYYFKHKQMKWRGKLETDSW